MWAQAPGGGPSRFTLAYPMLAGLTRSAIAQALAWGTCRRGGTGSAGALWALGVVLMMAQAVHGAGPYQWRQAVIRGGGYITGLYYHPHNAAVVYMRTDMGGAYRLDPKENRWIPLLDWVGRDEATSLNGISGIALDPRDDNKVYLYTGMYLASWGGNAAILKSGDRGASWTRVRLPFKGGANSGGRWCADRLRVDPNLPSTLLLGTWGGALYKSTDSAAIWNPVTSFPKITGNKYGLAALEFVGGVPGQATAGIYAGVNRNGGATLYQSLDEGRTWTEVQGGPGHEPARYLNQMVKDSDGNLLLVYANSADINMGDVDLKQGWLYRYEPAGNRWQLLRETRGYGIGAVAVDPGNAKVLMITSLARWAHNIDLWRSEDGGNTWKTITVQRGGEPPYVRDGWPYPHWMTDIDIAPGHSNVAMLSGVPGVYRCDDIAAARQTWTFYTDGMEQTYVRDLVSPPSGKAHLYSVVADVGGFRHEDLNVSPPNLMPSMDSELTLDFAQADPAKMVRTGSKRPFGAYSADAGVTWNAFTVPQGIRGGGAAVISADGGSILWVPEGAAHGLVSTDQGKSWLPSGGLPGDVVPAADRVSGATFYAYSPATGNLYRSTARGVTFAKIDATVGKKGHAMVLNPAVAGDWWIGGESGLFHSTDGGTTWSAIGGVAQVHAVGLGKAKTAGGYPAIYLAGQVKDAKGVFRSDDGGAAWALISDAAHQFGGANVVIGDPRLYGRVYLGTNGRGIVYGDPRDQ